VIRALLAAPVLVLALAGCNGDPEPSPAAATGATGTVGPEVRPGLVALYAGDHPGEVDTRNGECFADALVERTSAAQLEAAGITVDGDVVADVPPLDTGTAADWVAATFDCVDYFEESARAQVAFTKGRLDRREYAACLRGGVDLEVVRAALVATLAGDWDSEHVTALTRAQAECSTLADPG